MTEQRVEAHLEYLLSISSSSSFNYKLISIYQGTFDWKQSFLIYSLIAITKWKKAYFFAPTSNLLHPEV